MNAQWTRPRDEYGRAFYAPNEAPPTNEHFAHWRGLLTHPDAVHTPALKDHDRICNHGWIRSGEWWLHCGRCCGVERVIPSTEEQNQ